MLILPGLPHSSVVFALWLVPMFYVVFLGVFYNVSFYEFRFCFKKFFFLGWKNYFFFRFEKKVSSLVRFFTPLVAAVFVAVQPSPFALFWLSFLY